MSQAESPAAPSQWRTLIVILSLAGMGGLVCYFGKGNFADYASLLKYLGWAAAAKSGWEHHVKTRKGAAQSAA